MKKLNLTVGVDKRYYSEVLTSGPDGRIAFQMKKNPSVSYDVGFLVSLDGAEFTEVDLRVVRDSHITVMDGLKPGMQVKLRTPFNVDIYALV